MHAFEALPKKTNQMVLENSKIFSASAQIFIIFYVESSKKEWKNSTKKQFSN
jgi:hypothetical protein